MKFSHNKLWKLLINRNMNKGDLQKLIETCPSTISRMGRNEPVILKSNRIMELFYKIFMHQKFIIKRHAEERHLDKIHSLNRV